ncbi:hypothetical protein [Mesonia sp. HuA40]|uniref:hypothetical protein n=1 Tax=Mesonia sp. HuA40 TaxID=2602761 RepID=UPI0011CA8386|nr:hypothetical protein [Mesonia sp. HuA40]TXK71683.1 hypothetical protein FT993_08745 [Mesonia sp. HuA40]
MNRNIILLLIVLFFNSCKHDFTNRELKIYDNFDIGQTLIFKSDNNSIDTFKITFKKKYYNNWQPITRDGKYNPPNAVIKYEKLNSNDFKIYNLNKKKFENPELFHFRKPSPKSKTKISFEFQNFYTEFKQPDESLKPELIIVNNHSLQCYVFELKKENLKETDIQRIYFSKEFEILKYVFKNGTQWVRIK